MTVRLRCIFRSVFFGTLLVTGLAAMSPLVAASSNALAQGFQADSNKGQIVAGALVSAKDGSSRRVELATLEGADRLVGVADTDPLLVISSESTETEVVLGGGTSVLVSDINGSIKAGDKITVSPIAGVGMKATASGRIAGTAQANFDIKTSTTRTITDKSGHHRTIHLGKVPLQVNVAAYEVPGSNFLPPFVQNIANSIAGRHVSLIRIILCGLLLIASFVGIITLIYTSVRSGITAIGRNPLASKAIHKSLGQVAMVAVAILGGTLLASYFILIL